MRFRRRKAAPNPQTAKPQQAPAKQAERDPNPLERAKIEEKMAAFLAARATPEPEKRPGEFWRRLDMAQKLGVPLHEIGELPPGPSPRWDARAGHKLDPYRADPARRIPTQKEVDKIMRRPRGSLIRTYMSKPPRPTKFIDERIHGW
jgi:hypothetical protein